MLVREPRLRPAAGSRHPGCTWLEREGRHGLSLALCCRWVMGDRPGQVLIMPLSGPVLRAHRALQASWRSGWVAAALATSLHFIVAQAGGLAGAALGPGP